MEAQLIVANPDVERELVEFLSRVALDFESIDRKIVELEERVGIGVYSELVYLLSHLTFEPEVAKHHWRRIRIC